MNRVKQFAAFALLVKWSLVLATAVTVVVAPLAAQGTTPGYADLNVLIAALTGVATSFLVGGAKKLEAWAGTSIVSKLGNITPILVLALNLALPHVWTLLKLPGAVPDATVVVNTPVAFAISIGSRELYQLIFHKLPPNGGVPA